MGTLLEAFKKLNENLITEEDCIEYLGGNKEAGEILYGWLDAEDALEDDLGDVLDRDNILDLCDAATNSKERKTVLQAMGEWDEEEENSDVNSKEINQTELITKNLEKKYGPKHTETWRNNISKEMIDEFKQVGIDLKPLPLPDGSMPNDNDLSRPGDTYIGQFEHNNNKYTVTRDFQSNYKWPNNRYSVHDQDNNWIISKETPKTIAQHFKKDIKLTK